MSRKFASLFLTALCASCAVVHDAAKSGDVPPASSGLSMAPIDFKSGEPGVGQSLLAALDGECAKQGLDRNLMIVKKYGDLRFEILGFADNQECDGNECEKLSERRAKAVYEWLVANGANPLSFERVEGRGAEMPIADNSTEEGRSVNRRVEVNPAPSD